MEPLLSPREHQILKKAKRIARVYEEFGKSDREICDRLCSLGFLQNDIGLVFITEAGRAVVRTYSRSNIKTWAPIIISVISLIISIAAYLGQ